MEKKVKEVKKEVRVCPAKYIKNNIIIDFNGFGIIVENKLKLTSDKVKVSYQGEIGKSSFQFEVIR